MLIVDFKVILQLSLFWAYCHGFLFHFRRQSVDYKDPCYEKARDQWIEQPLDHFDSNERTWHMRYFERLENFHPNGPLYLQIGGEGESKSYPYAVTRELATESHGAIYLSEHRYYGKSLPLPTGQVDNLKYLSSRQALADLANLIRTLKESPKFKASKVVVVGGSYAGNLAAWMRLLYPELVDAAISSSAPVQAKVDFNEYFEKCFDNLKKYGTENCADKVTNIFRRYKTLFQTKRGITQLKNEENICDKTNMSDPHNQFLFIQQKLTKLAYSSQYGSPKVIKDFCKSSQVTGRIPLLNKDEDPYSMTSWNQNLACHNYDLDAGLIALKYIPDFYSWSYQTCTEFGYFQTFNVDAGVELLPVRFYHRVCSSLFGAEFDEHRVRLGVDATNKLYGGERLDVTRVVFANGAMDPWSMLGVLKDLSVDAPARVIPDVSHCKDLSEFVTGDPDELRETQLFEKILIRKWIGSA